jgi:hypothetical protein
LDPPGGFYRFSFICLATLENPRHQVQQAKIARPVRAAFLQEELVACILESDNASGLQFQ